MADEQTTTTTKGSGRGRMRTAIMVLALLIGEAALIFGAIMFVGGEPESVRAEDPMDNAQLAVEERIVEILVLDGKLPNAKTGVTYLYVTEIYAQVKQRSTQRIEEELSQFSNEIKAEIAALWRTSEPAHFKEPRLESLTRKVHALLSDRFGTDPQTGEPVIEKIVINMQPGYRIDA